MTRHEWLKQIARRFIGRGVSRFGLQLGVMLALGTSGVFAAAISVIAIVALGATLAFAGGEMGETMKRLLHVGIAVCCVVFAAQVMTSFIGQAAEVAVLVEPLHSAVSVLGHSAPAQG